VKKANPAHVQAMMNMVNQCPYFSLLSMAVRDLAMGRSLIEIEISQKHLQPFGIAHGGVFASLIDAAAFWAAFYRVENPDTGLTSVDLKLNYLAPASSGKLVARGRLIKLGKTLGYADAEVTNGSGKILAHGSATLMLLPGWQPADGTLLPPKFIETTIDSPDRTIT
jgi:uncharacterized protein (TIGR00369 family)